MTVIIQKNCPENKIDKKFRELDRKKKSKAPDWDKYYGKINFGKDGLTYQKKIRDEWG